MSKNIPNILDEKKEGFYFSALDEWNDNESHKADLDEDGIELTHSKIKHLLDNDETTAENNSIKKAMKNVN